MAAVTLALSPGVGGRVETQAERQTQPRRRQGPVARIDHAAAVCAATGKRGTHTPLHAVVQERGQDASVRHFCVRSA
jgi:hypothetical protein